jgi:hypothetical protein
MPILTDIQSAMQQNKGGTANRATFLRGIDRYVAAKDEALLLTTEQPYSVIKDSLTVLNPDI